ncbi:ABC transporter permease [Paenibacillus eucommiae]|uniref:Aldouronate transport system permease protein n=1 Tax=Paenibacillus eucommiae TaxID=1355755 RepID=A0ABS4IXI8_9BACL|nr:ABC transporter permease subunit [Paenibacillus eucommiae]MBP1992267.1 putative aldouronate transport system permease protein [Paenibacillus eucommiae]
MQITTKTLKDIKRFWFIYFMMIPAVAYFIIFKYYPMGIQTVLAFKKYELLGGVAGSPWVGFDNFTYLFNKSDIPQVLWNTVWISMLRIVAGFFPPLLLAIFLFDLHNKRLRRVSQTILYIPHFFSWVIVYAIVFAVFSNEGMVNQFLGLLGIGQQNFLMSPDWFRSLLVGSAIWKEIGWGTIIYLAGMSMTDPSLYEAAKMDGAGPWTRIWHVTLPAIRPIIIFLFTLSLGGILYAGGEQILLFYNPATMKVGDVIDTWIYRQGLTQLQYSLGAAMSLFQSLLGLILVIGANTLSRKYSGIGIW